MSDYLQENDEESSFLPQDNNNPALLDNASTSTIAMTMLFGSIIFTTSSIAARLWLTGLWSWRNYCVGSRRNNNMDNNSDDNKSQPLDITSLPSIYSLLYYTTTFGLILFYSYICEHHPPYFHEEKTYDRDEFFFWTILVVVFAGGHSIKSNVDIKLRNSSTKKKKGGDNNNNYKQLEMIEEDEKQIVQTDTNKTDNNNNTSTSSSSSDCNEILNRYQTEEWKGWMQFTFLLYHYMHAMEIYNGIRVMITCYVWMTGFGNLSFFYMTNDYSLPRVLQMVWRLNFLVFFLCLVHGNPYILYYICYDTFTI